jgi:hypothetical protein
MKRETQRFLIIGLFAILAISFFVGVINLASADPVSDFFDKTIKSSFENWKSGNLGSGTLKILYFVLLTILIFSVLELAGFINSPGLRWAISVIVSIIATAYITPEQFFAIGQEYSAMGLAISTFIPFLIISLFTVASAKDGRAEGLFLQGIIWWLFTGFLAYNWYMNRAQSYSGMLLVMAILSLIMAVLNVWVTKLIGSLYFNAIKEGSEEKLRAAIAMEKLQAKGLKDLAQ